MSAAIWPDPDLSRYLSLCETNARHRQWSREDERAMRYGDAEPVLAETRPVAEAVAS